ncbi:MAG: hypothetical protein Q9171_002886 [Xanthocarpia ochracea]
MALYAGSLALSKAGATLVNTRREFRLLILSPGEPSDQLGGELIKASLDDTNLQYTALSYTWGDPSDPANITLNDGHNLPITRNLEAALRQFRSRIDPVRLWVDAICINQADKEEKNSQVRIMRSIYVLACRTWVWLGSSDAESDRAMDIVQSFRLGDLTTNELRLTSRKDWEGIGNLMRRSWWTRIWVIQEVLSSRRVHVWCGSRMIDFECFVKLEEIRRDFAFRDIPTQPFANILSNWDLNQRIVLNGEAPLFEWMADTHKFSSTLRRDRIYALLGLSSEESRSAIVPDYTSRTSDSLLSTRATVHFLMQQKSLLPLQSGFYKKAEDLDLPSWVSDWSTSQAGYVMLVFNRPYNACGSYSTTTPRFSPEITQPSSCPENVSLILSGVVVGEIKIAEPMLEVPLYTGTDTNKDLESRMLRRELTRSTCQNWWAIYESFTNPIEESSSVNRDRRYPFPDIPSVRQEAFWRTIIADRALDGTGPVGRQWFRFFRSWLTDVEGEGITDFRNAAVSHCAGRSFILTCEGTPGLAPAKTKAGDIVCLLYGGDVPFVLRRLSSGDGCYQLIGETYVHGIMQGEKSEMLRGERVQDFEIV